MKNQIPTLFLILISFALGAQEFGGFRPSKIWLFQNRENIKIIHSPENKKLASNTLSILSKINALDTNIGSKRKPIKIVFQNSTTQANGYVGLAPFRSEFFLTPYPNSFIIGSLPWTYTLAIHEYQHVLQFSNTSYGLCRIAYWLGGEALWSGVVAARFPNWFFEGDAVRAETEYSKQGRGRIPHFVNGYRAYAKNGKFPHYFKARSGSIQDFVPNHYPLGYLMIAYGKEKYGDYFWTKVLKESARNVGVFYSFSRMLRRNTGLYSRKFYQAAMQDFQQKWEFDSTDNAATKTLIRKRNQSVNNYRFPQFNSDSSLLFFHSSYDKVGRIYEFKEKQLIKHEILGITNENYFSSSKNKVVFTRTFFDPRWTWNDYNDIVIYDLEKKQSKRITYSQKYFHPSFSADGSKLIALQVSPLSGYALCVINVIDGEVESSLANDNNYFFTYPQWLDQQTIIAATRDTLGRMAITSTDISNGTTSNVSPWTYHIIGRPQIKNKKVYFNSSYSGVDNIYSIDLSSQKITQLSSHGLGRYEVAPHPTKDSLYYVEFSLNGYQLKTIADSSAILKKNYTLLPLKDLKPYGRTFFDDTDLILAEQSDTIPAVNKYSKFKSLINFHSWETTLSEPNFGLSFLSRNVLNTLDLELGYEYNINERSGGVEAAFSYGQYFLHLDGSIQNRNRNLAGIDSLDWNENVIEVGLSLPLQLSSSQFVRRLNLYTYYQTIDINSRQDFYANTVINGIHSGFTYRQERVKARKNIFTHLGFYLNTQFQSAFNITSLHQILIQSAVALPGLASNHNIILHADVQKQERLFDYHYRDNFLYERGYGRRLYQQLIKGSFNYHFPISYPDVGAIGIVFIQRIRGNLFFDISNQNTFSYSSDLVQSSYGGELIFDTKLLHEFSFSIGLRYTLIRDEFALGLPSSSLTDQFEIFIPVSRF